MSHTKATQLIHDPQRGKTYTSANIPLYYSSTYHQQTLGGETTYDYARSGNPNRELLETKLAELENGTHGFAFNSGISAITSVFLTLKAGDHVILPDDVYGGTFRLTEQILSKFDIHFTTVNAEKTENFEKAITPRTRLIYVETPSNPLFKITHIRGVAQIAKKHNLLLAVDNTFMTPIAQNPLDLGADIVIHSATKFLGGHSDLIAGAVITNHEAFAEALYLIQNGAGTGLSVYDSWTLTQHLKTLNVRFQQSFKSAQRIVRFLEQHPAVADIYYPGYSTVHLNQATHGGAVFGFRLKHEHLAQTFVDALNIPLVSVSLGGVETILSHPYSMSHAAIPQHIREARGITFGLFRLSVGLEDPDTLISDLDYALKEVYDESLIEHPERHYSSG
ncbi:PLP-dependent aspartate aminotransferase family protein [Staphylococcus hyicus]|uniref:cystathionine beta-lyase MetC n=1 Tax=Staphylococcus hyicus TaxID=1284 RepID=UPI00211CD8F9|nr:cystathionine beta-lyase MetC [Staphylococcus hyicus]MCQ9291676.1 PLP-dependent aspartate aminotransferase family protein [Staphylococcus hyicus]MCQ9306917.1 PLP-dependent aspartate aminotransferase family protein [Staphylococcus hyicus]MCQ9309403.1 PLP-dependent aspartate aminotransferase family protein [Staphylococcus hyicus]MCQ9311751.1 PLP-dependent aspartate aminotransferase family protein [Staphylococcus hyicus]MDP4448519.1 PLP-dependent aspartate aminotransferase family protein [Stap